MKFITSLQSILSEVEKASTFAATKSAIGITSCIYIEAKDDNLYIRATDTKANSDAVTKAEVQEPGAVAVYADKLEAILRNMPKADIIFETKGSDTLSIHPVDSLKVKVDIRTQDATKFPERELKDDNCIAFTMKREELVRLSSQVSFAVGTDIARNFLTGVYMECTEGNLVLVATDGRRLAYATTTVAANDFSNVIIPARFFAALGEMSDEMITISIQEGRIFAETATRVTSMSLIGKMYPNWRRVIPANPKYSLKINANHLLSAINLTSILSDAKTKTITLEVDNGHVTVDGMDANYGRSSQVIDCIYEGPCTKVRMNVLLLPSCLKNIKTTNLIARFTDDKTAWMFAPEGNEDVMYVIAPMSV